LTPYQALECATRNPHEWLGDLDRVGTISPGKRADLVLLSADPLDNISNTRAIAGLVVRGKWIDKERIDARLEAARVKLSSAPLLETR
jgi:imidazolonepropionase-like amidohydrolase